LSQSSKSASARTALLNTTRISAAAAIEMGGRGGNPSHHFKRIKSQKCSVGLAIFDQNPPKFQNSQFQASYREKCLNPVFLALFI